MNRYANVDNIAMVVAAGNETNARSHYLGSVLPVNDYEDVEIVVGENQRGFALELWAKPSSLFSVGFLSPSGELVNKITARLNQRSEISFLFERARIYLDYNIIETVTGDTLVFMRFVNPDPGSWKVRVYNDGDIADNFHMWLPIRQFIGEQVFFNNPNPNTLICEPGNVYNVITAAGYNAISNSIFVNSSRGYTRYESIKPDMAAPAVDVYGPMIGGGYGVMTGTSTAAALTAGVSALLFEWLNDQGVSIGGNTLKNYLIKGAVRGNLTYPNREWGYGKVNIYDAFESLRTTS